MLETIFSWLVSVLGELMDTLISAFLGLIRIDLSSLAETFPALTTGYRVFQALGLGLILLIASVQMFKLLVGNTSEARDTPFGILIRSGIAAMLIWFGGFFVELAIGLARIPYDLFTDYESNNVMSFTEFAENFDSFQLIDGVALVIGPAALLVLIFILLLLIGWNLFKLIVEVCERFLMIGVLAYTAPLIYPTLSSRATTDIFRRWVGMFCGQCAIMTISAWMLKVVVSGFSFTETDTNIFFRLLLTLALCKIAQRVDTYMQQLGIGVATTGGNILDEAIGMAMMFRRAGRRGESENADGGNGRSPGGPVLGAGPDGSLSRFGGLFGGVSNAAQRAAQQWKEGKPVTQIGANVGKDFLTGMGTGTGTETVKDAVRNPDLSAKERVAKGFKGAAQIIGGSFLAGTPANTVQRFQEARETARREDIKRAYAGAAEFDRRSGQYRPPDDASGFQDPQGRGYDNSDSMSETGKETRSAQQAAMQTASQFFASQRAANGVGGYQVEDGVAYLDPVAEKAGLRLELDRLTPMIEGRDDVVGDFMARNYQEIGKNDDMQEFAVNAAQYGSPLAAEQALNNPYCMLEGNDELGDVLLKSAYGEQAITGRPESDLGGTFQNIYAENTGEHGRMIHADYTANDGTVTHYTIRNAEALNESAPSDRIRQFADGVAGKETTIQGVGSGTSMYVHQDQTAVGAYTTPKIPRQYVPEEREKPETKRNGTPSSAEKKKKKKRLGRKADKNNTKQ